MRLDGTHWVMWESLIHDVRSLIHDGTHEKFLLSGCAIPKSNEICCRRRRWMLSAAAADEYKLVFIKNNYFLLRLKLMLNSIRCWWSDDEFYWEWLVRWIVWYQNLVKEMCAASHCDCCPIWNHMTWKWTPRLGVHWSFWVVILIRESVWWW